jgi:hypothetical protein
MPAPIQGNDIVKIRWYATLGNQASVITHYFNVPAATLIGSWDPALVLTNYLTLIATPARNCMAILAHFDGGSIQIVTVKPYSALIYSNQGNGNGTMTGNPQPTQVCGMVSRRTDFAGRSYRGRIYMPFMSNNAIDTNGLPAITYTNLLGLFIAQAEPAAGITMTASGKSIVLNPIIFTRNPKAANSAITGHEYPAKFGTQHRRGSYGKPNFTPALTPPS